MNYAVIMAGGSGKRLWPLSRMKRPKQVLKLIQGQTLLGLCFDRLTPIFDPEHILVLTNIAFVDIVRDTLPQLPKDNVIAEPAIRDTASAIALAAAVLLARDKNACMTVVTADQIMRPAEVFQQAVRDALVFIDKNPQNLITFGVKPDFASTQYGYLKCAKGVSVSGLSDQVYEVETFKEKPDTVTAQQYLEAGNYFWNAGMFVWQVSTILSNIYKFLPEAVEPLEKIAAAWGTDLQESVLKQWFIKMPKISIDFAVMERAEHVSCIRLDCNWLDLGSFKAMTDVVGTDAGNNVIAADTHELLDCENNIIVTEQHGHLIAGIGLKDMIVAHSKDATLICPADQIDRLKELLERIEKNGRGTYL